MDTKKQENQKSSDCDMTHWIEKGRESLKREQPKRKDSTRKTLHDRGVDAWKKMTK